MATRDELQQRRENLAAAGRENEVDVILVYFDEYNMADGYYLTNIWTQFERGLVALASATAEVCLLVGPETANYVATHEADLRGRIVSLFQAWGAGYPNTEWEEAADVLTEMVGHSPRPHWHRGLWQSAGRALSGAERYFARYRRPQRKYPERARNQNWQRDRQYQNGVRNRRCRLGSYAGCDQSGHD